jgi:hypothetical protein
MSLLSQKKKKQNDLLTHKASIMMKWADINRGGQQTFEVCCSVDASVGTICGCHTRSVCVCVGSFLRVSV